MSPIDPSNARHERAIFSCSAAPRDCPRKINPYTARSQPTVGRSTNGAAPARSGRQQNVAVELAPFSQVRRSVFTRTLSPAPTPRRRTGMAEQGTQEYPTIPGPGASFKGEMSFEKGLRLMGKFEGKINTGGRLHVAREAK